MCNDSLALSARLNHTPQKIYMFYIAIGKYCLLTNIKHIQIQNRKQFFIQKE